MGLNKQNMKSLDSIIVLVLKILLLLASLVNGGGYSYYKICQREPELGDKGIQCSPGINEYNDGYAVSLPESTFCYLFYYTF